MRNEKATELASQSFILTAGSNADLIDRVDTLDNVKLQRGNCKKLLRSVLGPVSAGDAESVRLGSPPLCTKFRQKRDCRKDVRSNRIDCSLRPQAIYSSPLQSRSFFADD